MSKSNKGKTGLVLFVIMLANFIGMGEFVVTPIINNIFMEFPNDTAIVNSIVSAPAILNVAGSLSSAALFKLMGRKRTLILGAAIFAVCSVLCYFAENAVLMLVLRLIAGFGMGVVTVGAVSMIAALYEDEGKRAAAMGYYNASMSVIGILLTLTSGFLATEFWRCPFLLYLVCIPVIILFMLVLPDIRSSQEATTEEKGASSASEGKAGFGGEFWKTVALFFVYNICNGVCLYFVSVYIFQNALGDEAFAGIASAVMTLVGLPFCIAFGKIYGTLRGKFGVVMYAVAGIGMIAAVLNVSNVQVIITWGMLGIAYGSLFAYVNQRASVIVPVAKVDSALGIVTAGYALGAFLSTYFASLCMAVMGTDLITPVFMVTGIICVVLAVIEVFTNRNWKASRDEA